MARLGTPENPEVIEPGRAPRAAEAPFFARLSTGVRLFKSLVVTCAPAVLFDYAWVSLVGRAWREQNALSLLFAMLITPPALVASAVAALAGPLLLASLVFLMIGRPVVATPGRRFRRFGLQRR